MDMHLDAAASAFGGGALVFALAKWAVTSTVAEVKEIKTQLAAVREHLAEISGSIKLIAEHETEIKTHALKLAAIEAKQPGGRNVRKNW